MTWYQTFILLVIALRLVAAPRDRNALSIVLVASFVSTLLVNFVTREITAPWKLAIPGAVETLTILAMFHWARNRTGYLQAACLVVAWAAHALCYLDIALKTDLVYSRYESIIQLVAVAQILAFYDTFARCGGAAADWIGSFRLGGDRGVRVAGMHDSVLPCKTDAVIPPARGTEEGS